MKNYHRYSRNEKLRLSLKTEYPIWSMIAALALIYLSPFVSSLLSYLALLICMYRVVRFDERVAAVDYCLLLPLSFIFCTSGGFSLLVWLSLFTGVWYVIRRGLRGDASLFFLLLLVNYLTAQMQLDVKRFVLSVGSMLAIYMLLPRQDSESAARASKAFSIGLILSSVYALVLRNNGRIRALRGAESEAIWQSGIMRFMGLMSDPNYYMAMVIIALGLLIKLRETKRITVTQFWAMGFILTFFGMLSYSKTFLLVFVLMGAAYIIWQFRNGKVFRGVLLCTVAAIAAAVLLFSEWSPMAVILERLLGGEGINDMTTGRWEVFLAYQKAITQNVTTALFGRGMAAERLFKEPHNLYLEILYHFGLVGLILYGCFFLSLIGAQLRGRDVKRQNLLAKYLVVGAALALFMTLNGVFQAYVYGDFFVALLSVAILAPSQTPGAAGTDLKST